MSADSHPAPEQAPPEPLSSGWLASERPAWLRYGAAIALTLLSVWLRVALAPAESGGRFVTPALAVALAALFGGLGPGLVSTILGMVLVNFFMVEPYGSFALGKTVEAFWLNAWHLVTQLVVVGAIALMQSRNRQLRDAAQQIRQGQQRFLDTFEHAASGISHVDIHGRLLRANQTFCRMVGYSKAALEGMSFQDITMPDDLAADLHLLNETLAGLRTSYTLEKRYRHQEGHVVWAQLTVALMRKSDGEPDYFISVVQDISAQKAAEDALRTSEALLQQAQKLSLLAAWQGDLVTGRYRPLAGSHGVLGLSDTTYEAAEMVALTHPEDQPGMLERWYGAIKSRQIYSHEYRVIIHGHQRWFTAQATFEYDDAGRAVRALGVIRDITEEKEAQLEVQRLNALLEQRIRERTRALRDAYAELESYSYAVAHDLRSPLRIINGFAQVLQDDNPRFAGANLDHLDRIKAASKKMGELINGLLKLSQVARGELQRVPVNLGTVATRILEELVVTEPGRRVGWEVEDGLVVQADAALTEALMQNLLHNAWKYSAKSPSAHIRVFARATGGGPEYCVSDNGAGFDMVQVGKLFQPFQRLHQQHEFAGLGIGLATAQRIVKRHGGELRADSAPGQGATFGFTLPDTGTN